MYLHGFSDASEMAYAACVYIKYVTKTGGIGVTFMTSKSRVVPVKKKFTIPRLELLGNVILAKLMTSVRDAVYEELTVKNYLCWSDSMIALSWIKSKKELGVFEENRVTEIKKNVSPDKWLHCRSEENPADVITRFHLFDQAKSDLYYNGPAFLKEINEDQYVNTNNDVINVDNVNDFNNVEVSYDNDERITLSNVSEELANLESVIDIKK